MINSTLRIILLIVLFIFICTSVSTTPVDEEKSLIALYNGIIGHKGTGDGEFIEPLGLCFDNEGNLYIVDSGNCRIQVFDKNDEFIRSFGSFGWEEGKFLYPVDCAVDDELAVYISDLDKGSVYKFSVDDQYLGEILPADTPLDDTILNGYFNQPLGLEIGRSGELFVVNSGEHQIDIFNRLDTPLKEFGGFGRSEGFFNHPYDCAVDKLGTLYVADTLNNRIQIFNTNLFFLNEITSADEGSKLNPIQIDVGLKDYIVVSDGNSNEVLVYTFDLERILTIKGETAGGFNMPYGIAISDNYDIYISDRFNHRIVKYQLTEPPPE